MLNAMLASYASEGERLRRLETAPTTISNPAIISMRGQMSMLIRRNMLKPHIIIIAPTITATTVVPFGIPKHSLSTRR